MRPHPDGLLWERGNQSCQLRSARSPRRLSPVTGHIPARAVSRAPRPVPPMPFWGQSTLPARHPIAKGSATRATVALRPEQSRQALGGRRPGLSMGLGRVPAGWLFFLPPDPYPKLSEAEAGSRPDAPLWPKEIQGQSALSTLVRCSSGRGSCQCGSAAGLGGPPEGVWPGVRRPGFHVVPHLSGPPAPPP